MKIQSKNLPKSERFACSKTDVKMELSETPLDDVDFGYYRKSFYFERTPKPKITGKIIAYLTVTPLRKSSLSLYPIRCDDYNDEASAEFTSNILPEMRKWVNKLYESTEINNRWGFVVEWSMGKHCIHKGNYY